jgi:hypothetical protein
MISYGDYALRVGRRNPQSVTTLPVATLCSRGLQKREHFCSEKFYEQKFIIP